MDVARLLDRAIRRVGENIKQLQEGLDGLMTEESENG
jgi:hypothetical protein